MSMSIRKKLIHTLRHMKERCYDEANKRYSDWGARGITICNEWLNDPQKFVDWSITGINPACVLIELTIILVIRLIIVDGLRLQKTTKTGAAADFIL